MLRFERVETKESNLRRTVVVDRYIKEKMTDASSAGEGMRLSDEYRVAFAGKRLGSIYMVEAEQFVLLRNIVEYVIW